MVQIVHSKGSRKCPSSVGVVLIFTHLAVFLFARTFFLSGAAGEIAHDDWSNQSINSTATSSSAWNMASSLLFLDYILIPPKGEGEALPGIRVAKDEFKSTNEIYGGKGDKQHLGGWTDLDRMGVSPATWKWMVTHVGIHSVLDVGCGRGISTSWFYFHGIDVRCVEGSRDAIENTVLPDPALITEHDFSRGPWWPAKTYDAVWCVEFIEHVGRNLQKNYLPAFRKAALIFVTHSSWGGHHHVEVHDEQFWVTKFTMFGFVYSEDLTKRIRKEANEEIGVLPNGEKANAQHIWLNMKVFINPAVAGLPQHAHLLAEPGCYQEGKNTTHRECGEGNTPAAAIESKLPPEFQPLTMTIEQDRKWFEHVKERVKQIGNYTLR